MSEQAILANQQFLYKTQPLAPQWLGQPICAPRAEALARQLTYQGPVPMVRITQQ
jgi:hypothetical protein